MRLNHAFALTLAAALPVAIGSLATAQVAAPAPKTAPAQPPAAPAAAAPAKVDDANVAKAKQILIDSAAAIKAMKGVTMTAKRSLEGGGFPFSSEAKVWFLRNSASPTASLFMMKGGTKQPGAEFMLEVYFNGSTAMWRDDTKKELVEKPLMAPDQAPKLKTARLQLLPIWFFDAEPYLSELKANTIALDTPAQAAGIDCEVVRVMNNANSESRIFIAKTDKLPRRVEQISRSGEKSTAFILDLLDLNAEDVKPADFRLDVPEGYQKRVEEPIKPVQPPTPPGQPPAQAPVIPKGGLDTGAAAPAWSLRSAEGGTETLAGQKGKAVVLAFWGPIFADSKPVLALMEQTRKGYQGKNVAFYGAACRHNGDKGLDGARKMFQEAGAGFPMLVDGDVAASEYKVRGYPSITVIDAAGNVAAFFENAPTADQLKGAVDRAMAADGGK